MLRRLRLRLRLVHVIDLSTLVHVTALSNAAAVIADADIAATRAAMAVAL